MDTSQIDSLTERQRQCLRLVSRDRDAKEIARILGLSPETVRGHIKSAMSRLGVGSRFEAARRLAEIEGTPPWRGDPSWGMGLPTDPIDQGGVQSTKGSGIEGVCEARPGFAFGEGYDARPIRTGARHDDLTFDRLMRIVKLVAAIALILLLAGPISESFQNVARLARNAIP